MTRALVPPGVLERVPGWCRRSGLHLAVIGSYLAIALLHLRPLGAVFGSAIARGNREDALLHGWILNWTARGLWRAPWDLFESNSFFPFPRSLAYTAHFIPEALPVVPVQALTGDPVLTYNVAFVLSFVLWGWGTFLLVRRLTGSVAAGWVAGAFACWFPAKRWSLAHFNTISLQWVPFALLALHRLLERPRVAAAIVAGMLVVLASLSSAYYTIYFPLLLIIAVPLQVWAGRHQFTPGRVAAVLLAAAVAIAMTFPVLWTYGSLYSAERGDYEYVLGPGGGADVAEFFVLDSWVWARTVLGRYSDRSTAGFFPGAVALTLALVALLGRRGTGLVWGGFWSQLSLPWRGVYVAGVGLLTAAAGALISHLDAHFRAWIHDVPAPMAELDHAWILALLGAVAVLAVERQQFPMLLRRFGRRVLASPRTVRVFAALTLVAGIVTLGQRLQFFGYQGAHLPVYWLYRWFPVLGSLRAPFRIGFLGTAFFAVLVGYGAAVALQRLQRWRLGGLLGACGLVLLMQVEYLGPPLTPTAPPARRPVDAWLAQQPGEFGIIELPQPVKLWQTARGQWQSVHHWKSRVTGHNTFVPLPIVRLHRVSRPPLQDLFLDYLVRDFPVRYVLLDLDALDPMERDRLIGERLPELDAVLQPLEQIGSVLVLQVNNGGNLGTIKRRFPRWMVQGTLRLELATMVTAELDGARLSVRRDAEELGLARLREGQRVVEIPVPDSSETEALPTLTFRLGGGGEAGLEVTRIRFVWESGLVYP